MNMCIESGASMVIEGLGGMHDDKVPSYCTGLELACSPS